MDITMDNLGKAWESGATEGEMEEVLELIRSGQWLWDYSIASHGSFYHGPEETLRLLSLANEKAQQARLKLVAVLAKHDVFDYVAPDFSTKEKAQKLAGVHISLSIHHPAHENDRISTPRHVPFHIAFIQKSAAHAKI